MLNSQNFLFWGRYVMNMYYLININVLDKSPHVVFENGDTEAE